jgi:hypothetical protein
MAEKNGDKDFFQTLFGVLLDMLEPALAMFSDNQAKAELLGSLGLDGNVNSGSLPATTNLDRYIQAEAGDVDEFMLLSAMADLTQVMLAIEGVVRVALQGEDNSDAALDEIINAFFNILLMDYVRRQSPGVHAFANLIIALNKQTAARGGTIRFVDDVIVDFFKRLGKGLETEEGASAVSEAVFMSFAGILILIQKLILDKTGTDSLLLALDYGYEGVEGTATPIADRIANRTLSCRTDIVPLDDPDNRLSLANTFAFVPEEHGGAAFITELFGGAKYTLPITADMSLDFDVSGDGLFRIGTADFADTGTHNRIKLTFKHKREDTDLARVFPNPEMKLGLGTYSVSMSVMPDDFQIAFSGKLPITIKRKPDAGFPLSLLPAEIKEKIPLDCGYSLTRDFFFGNGGGNAGSSTESAATSETAEQEPEFIEKILAKMLNMIDLRIPLHKDIGGVVGLQLLNLKTEVVGNFATTRLETSLDFWVKFGPVLTVSISRLGAELNLTKRDDNGGLLGYDLTPDFKPPTGAGVRVNAEVIKGGGFLYFDDKKGEYFGSLELEFKELFTLKAVGIINTIMPDGEKGFSMLILITAEFSPVQLGFGFTLSGVGGLLGIDRTADVEALRVGIRTNAVRSILFPQDVVGNITRIVSDIREIFPVKQDQFLVGLMAKLGWGTPTLIHIEMGLIVEIPDPRIMLLGVVRTSLPAEDAAVLKLQVNFFGLLDFDNELIYFEAHLFQSRLVGFPLTGSLAFAVAWGDQSVFAISVGGFHPDFRDYPLVPTLPGAFREMSRVGLSLLSGNNPRLTVECYMAVTSNTVQLGAKLELLASGPMGFNLYGMLAFDTLFIFDPFSFVISLEATLAIRQGRSILFGIHFKGLLSGPTPWHVEGSVTFGLLFFDVTISFSETWGDPLVEIASDTEDLLGLLRNELDDIRNWRAITSQTLHQGVTRKSPDGTDEKQLIVDPFGELQFSQRMIPLDFEIEKYGNKRPLSETKLGITEVLVGEVAESRIDLTELFAAANYIELTEQEKLSRKSFEKFTSGFSLQNTGSILTPVPHLDPVELDYELNYTQDDKPLALNLVLPLAVFKKASRSAAVARSPLGWARSGKTVLNSVAPVKSADGGYAIANVSDLKEHASGLRSASLTEAKARLNTLIAENPDLEDEIQIVESYELAS